MSPATTTWRALRNVLCFGRHVQAGELLDLTPAQVNALAWMGNTIEPASRETRRVVSVEPVVTWGPPVETQQEAVRMRIRTRRSRGTHE